MNSFQLCTASGPLIDVDGMDVVSPGPVTLERQGLTFDSSYKFPTGELKKAVDRNWKPYAFNVEGEWVSEMFMSNYSLTLGGSFDVAGPTPFPFAVPLIQETVDNPIPMPNFTTQTRTMINWLGSGGPSYPNTFEYDISTPNGAYPLMQRPDGTALGGGLAFAVVTLQGEISPYNYIYNGEFYVIQNFTATLSIQNRFPGEPSAILETGSQSQMTSTFATFITSFEFVGTQIIGSMEIKDMTRIPEESWGTADLFGFIGNADGSVNFSVLCQNRYLHSGL